MKKIFSLLIIAVVLLGGCASEQIIPLDETDFEEYEEYEPDVEDEFPSQDSTPVVPQIEPKPEIEEEPPIIIENDPVPPLTDEEILILKAFVQRVCGVRGTMPYFDDINDVELRIILQQYFNVYGWDWSDTDVFSDGENQHHYSDEETENHFGAVLGVSPARLEEYMKEYYNLFFSIKNYDYKAMTWDDERELIVGSIYGGSPHWWIDTRTIEIREENGEYHAYALKVSWSDGWFQYMEYIHCTFTKNTNGNFNIMSKQLVPESEKPEQVSEFLMFIDRIANDVDIAYEYAVEFDVFAEIDERRGCWDCNESPRNLCDYCINSMAIWIIFREAFEIFKLSS
jgi:hypothetical protein